MARGKIGAPRPKGTRQGKPLSDLDKELIRQTQMICQNKNETARRCGITRKTVETVLAQGKDQDESIIEARRQSAIAIAGKVHGKVDKILDAIGPEDLESGYYEWKDKDGKVYKRSYYGPSLLQKITAGAILIDKLPVLSQYQQAISADHASGQMLLPGDYQALVSGIQSKIKSLSVLNIQFESDNPSLSQRAQEVIAEAEILSTSADEVIDFDNPGVAHEGEERTTGVDPEHDGVPHRARDNAGSGDGEG